MTSQDAETGQGAGNAIDAVGGPLRAPNKAVLPTATPRISVVIPLYNHRNFIEDTLKSVSGQTLQPAEIIVVDDGSTDGSAQIVTQLAERHPKIIFWSHPNQGAHYTLNAAIHRATGDFVSILNSDDIYHAQRLEQCARAMHDHPNASAVFTGVRFIDGHGHKIENAWYSQAIAFYKENADLSLALANANLVVSTSNLFLRRSVFAEIGYFAPLRYTHDMDFCLRLLAHRNEICFEDQSLLSYRIHGSNTIAEDRDRIDIERAAVLAFFIFQIYGHRTTTVAETWSNYLTRFIDILESQTLAKLVASFLSYLTGVTRNELDRLFLAPEAQFRSYLDTSGVDWLSRGEPGSPATALSEDLARQRSQSAGAIRKLEDAIAWHAEQNSRLLELLQQKETIIADQAAWIATLEEAREWLTGQNQSLEQRLRESDAMKPEE